MSPDEELGTLFVISESMLKLNNRNGASFGLKIYRNQNMDGRAYNDLLVHTVIPQLKALNGGVLDPLIWQQDGAR